MSATDATAASSPSPFVRAVEPITETDEQIREHLSRAELPPLLPALAYLTGDLSLLKPHLRTDPMLGSMPQGGLTDDQQAEIRAMALDVLCRYRDGGCVPAAAPSDADLLAILEYEVGVEGMTPYLPLLEEELAYRGEDRRAPQWHKQDTAPDTDFHVVIIGAGMSGILAAHRLQQAGVAFTILDKNSDVGGTWFESVYPGCRVDNPNHNYSYSFAQRHDWPFHYSTQGVLRDYFASCADAFGIREHIRFDSPVRSATWNESTSTWTIRYSTPDDGEADIEANAVISAVGQLNRPKFPTTIEGFGTFEGVAFHSAQWRHDVDFTGKRVACIGTGASALQFLPVVSETAADLVIFQRTPPWLAPTEDYHEPIHPSLTWLYGHVPSYSEFNRFAIFWRMGDGALAAVSVDPEWKSDGASVNEISDITRQLLTGYLQLMFADRPDLLAQVVPTYPPGAKRMVRDNGVWASTLKKPQVHLVGEEIAAITPTGIRMVDGTEHEVDVLIYGTGYEASNFLTPVKVSGVGGQDLHEMWAGDARAYLGVTIPGFPNLWCLYGPNTNIVINGSIIYFSECGVRYIVGLVREILANGAAAIDVKPDVHDAFNEAVDAENKRMAWGWSDVSSWYKNDHGRVAQNWPFTLLDYWQRTLAPDPAEYTLLP